MNDYDDGATCHWTPSVVSWKDKKLPDYVPKEMRPANSPDFNLIENCFSLLADAVLQKAHTNRADLKKCVQKAWREIPVDFVQNCYNSLDRRFNQCTAQKGRKTEY